MNILIAPDKFKGTLTSLQVCRVITEALTVLLPQASCKVFPMADGGDGTVSVMLHHTGGTLQHAVVHDALGRPVPACYGISHDGGTAFIEMAAASGLALLSPEERNPLHTSTFGTGELIKHACKQHVKRIFLGIGGSATNDGGAGALAALGIRFTDNKGREFVPAGGTLAYTQHIDLAGRIPELDAISLTALCDVSSPFTGPEGASYAFSLQKGANSLMATELEMGMQHFAGIISRFTGINLNTVPGSGAGGGIAGGLHALAGATLVPGIRAIMELTRFDEALQWADVVITGEGQVDGQTGKGKVVQGVLDATGRHRKRVVVICGKCTVPAHQIKVPVFELTAVAGEERSLAEPEKALQETCCEVAAWLSKLME